MATDAELLTAVTAAIEARLNNGAVQSYSIGGRNLQYMNITELYNLKANLEKRISAGTSTRNYGTFRRPQ